MEKKLLNARTIAWVLGVLLVIALIVIYTEHQTIAKFQGPGGNITAQQDFIRQDCAGLDADSKARCADDLQRLSDLLAQFAPKATTTPGITGGVNNVQVQQLPKK